jgi:hypothetical protein
MKNLFIHTFVVFVLGALLASCVAQDPRSYRFVDSPGNIANLQQSVVWIFKSQNLGQPEEPACSGFFVSRDLVATAYHCVRPPVTRAIELAPGLTMFVPVEGKPEPVVGRTVLFMLKSEFDRIIDGGEEVQPNLISSTVVQIDVVNDLALLSVEDHQSNNWVRVQSRLPMVGETVDTMGMHMSQPWVLTEGLVSAIRRRLNAPDRIIHQAGVAPGASGSPLVNKFGYLVGINVGYIRDVRYGIAIPTSYLERLIQLQRQSSPTS